MAPQMPHLAPLVLLLLGARVTSSPLFAVIDDVYGEGDEAIQLKVLRNTMSGEEAHVLWSWGGKLDALSLSGGKGLSPRPVIFNHSRDASAIRSNGSPGAILTPFSNRVANGTYTWDGETHYLEKNAANNAMHGFLIDGTAMEVTFTEADDDHATVGLRYVFGGEKGYPFNVSLDVNYTLSKGLKVSVRAENLMKDRSAPFMYGQHPYWKVADVSKTTVTFDQCSKWNHIDVTADPDLIPTGTTRPVGAPFDGSAPIGGNITHPTRYDDGFKAISSIQDCPYLETQIQDGDDTLYLLMGRSFRFLQVYTGSPDKGVAVEPQAGETNCWNNKDSVISLQAGEVWKGWFEIFVQSGVYKKTNED